MCIYKSHTPNEIAFYFGNLVSCFRITKIPIASCGCLIIYLILNLHVDVFLTFRYQLLVTLILTRNLYKVDS